jgi:hypothetical protein
MLANTFLHVFVATQIYTYDASYDISPTMPGEVLEVGADTIRSKGGPDGPLTPTGPGGPLTPLGPDILLTPHGPLAP